MSLDTVNSLPKLLRALGASYIEFDSWMSACALISCKFNSPALSWRTREICVLGLEPDAK